MSIQTMIADLFTKAIKAHLVAKLALEEGNYDDAASRAYYAMFNAARCLLISVDQENAEISTHAWRPETLSSRLHPRRKARQALRPDDPARPRRQASGRLFTATTCGVPMLSQLFGYPDFRMEWPTGMRTWLKGPKDHSIHTRAL